MGADRNDVAMICRNDRVLIRRCEEPQKGLIVAPQIAETKSMQGIVLSVGPGKWIEGTWWKIGDNEFCPDHGDPIDCGCEWMWIPGHRQQPEVCPGQKVLFNSKWNDFSADHYDDLPLGADKMLHLVQEADILAVING